MSSDPPYPRQQFVELPKGKHGQRKLTLDIARASRFAELCNLTYYIPENAWTTPIKRSFGFHKDIAAEAKKLGYKLVKTLATDNMHVGIFANDDGLVVAFRGTNKYSRFELNRAFSYDQHTFIENDHAYSVHAASHDALWDNTTGDNAMPLHNAIAQEVTRYLDEHRETPPKLYFTGHSIGGNLAVLCANDMLRAYPQLQVESIYSFGQPRVGDKAFAERIDNHPHIAGGYWRFVMAKDPIPLIPGKYARGQNHKTSQKEPVYKHGGEPIIIDPKAKKLFARSSTKTVQERLHHPNLIKASQLWMSNTFAFYANFPQHKLLSYCKMLSQFSEREATQEISVRR